MRIAVDVLGGDHAPEAPVRAAVQSVAAGNDLTVLLVGPRESIEPWLARDGEEAVAKGLIELVAASEVITPDEPPVAALRRKKDSTIVVGLRLVREKRADAFVSAGSTGALMAGAFRQFGRIHGVPRPALATLFPSLGPGGREVLFLDLGANADARPEHLRAHAVMGSVYAERVLGRVSPRVGLLSNGAEAAKGSELVKAAHRLMTETPGLNFVGNVEGRDIFSGALDVVVTDGFTGNVVTKTVEGLVEGLFSVMKQEFTRGLRGKVGALLLVPALRSVKGRLDYTEYGGAPFLGLAGACVKCHGSSNAKAIRNGIQVARRYLEGRVIEVISDQLSALPGFPGETDDSAAEE
jgi:glycerol-3-phosphate acyltransferase PlsX